MFAAIAVTALVVALGRPADANHRFNDVGTGTFFHNSTGWLKDNGIADGFSDGTFRTGDNITRGQASYWFSNYNNAITTHSSSVNPVLDSSFSHAATCPSGKRPIAGSGTTDSDAYLHVTASRPLGLDSWQVTWTATDLNTFADPELVRVYVTCVPNNIP
jgi:hypothetical protein